MELNVQIKSAGKKKQEIVSAKLVLEKAPHTVEDLISMSVKATRRSFMAKKSTQEGTFFYTDDEIANKAVSGKVGFGILEGNTDIPETTAVQNALDAFRDGLFAMFIDGERYDSLDEQLHVTGGETLTFVKLTMLAGRMW